jgi:hypothetical protein
VSLFRLRPVFKVLLAALLASAVGACGSRQSPTAPTGVAQEFLVIVRAADADSGANLSAIQVTVVGGTQDGLTANSQSDQVPIQLRAGDVTLRVAVSGYSPVDQHVTVAAAATITVKLSARVVTLSGRVTDAQTGEAVSGATVTASAGTTAGRSTLADGTGMYSFAGLGLGSVTVSAERAGYTATSRSANVSSDTGSFDITLPRLRTTLAGRITLTGGTATQHTTLEILDGPDRGKSIMADGNGNYTLGQIYWGTFRVGLSGSCQETTQSTVTIPADSAALGGTLTQNYSLPVRGFTISGTATELPFNRASVGAIVRLVRSDTGTVAASATTDGAGHVAFGGVCGDFVARPEKSDFNGRDTQIQHVVNNVDATIFLEWATYQLDLTGGFPESQARVEVISGAYAGASTSFGPFKSGCDCSDALLSIRGPSTVRISKPGFQTQTLTLDIEQPTSMNIRLVPSS